jgi:hypothetical protein
MADLISWKHQDLFRLNLSDSLISFLEVATGPAKHETISLNYPYDPLQLFCLYISAWAASPTQAAHFALNTRLIHRVIYRYSELSMGKLLRNI